MSQIDVDYARVNFLGITTIILQLVFSLYTPETTPH